MAGANRGKPKPASDRRHEVAASAIIYNNNKLECVIRIKNLWKRTRSSMQSKGIDNISLNRLERYNHPSTDKRYSLKKARPKKKKKVLDFEI